MGILITIVMQALIFDYKKQVENLQKSKDAFLRNDFLYKHSEDMIREGIYRSKLLNDSVMLYGHYNFLRTELYTAERIKTAFLYDIYGNNAPNFTAAIEEDLSLISESFGMVCSNLSLNFINNIEGVLRNYHRSLKHKGLFIATLIGESSFWELRDALAAADYNAYSGVFTRVMPVVSAESIIKLMSMNKFVDIVSNIERIELRYNSLLNMLRELRDMGFGNFLISKSPKLSKDLLNFAEAYYRQNYSIDKMLKLSIDIIMISGFKADYK